MFRFSFVLINPPHDYVLRPGDIIYLLKPGATAANTMNLELSTEAGHCHSAGGPNSSAAGQSPDHDQQVTVGKETTTTGDTQTPSHSSKRRPSNGLSFDVESLPTAAAAAALSSHMSIDESWLEDAMAKDSSLHKSKLNFESLKKLFFPSSIVSLHGSAGQSAQPQQIDEEEAARLTEMGQVKVRSKSVAAPIQYRRGKVSKQALRKIFYNRNKFNRRDDMLNNNI